MSAGVHDTIRLALKLARASRVRIALSVLLVTVAMTVFLVVSQLSRVGSEGLDEAIDETTGQEGSYAVETLSTFGLPPEEFLGRVTAKLEALQGSPVNHAVGYTEVPIDCPPFEGLGRTLVRVAFAGDGSPFPLPYGERLPQDTKVCISGVEIPAEAVLEPDAGQSNAWGIGLFIAPAYESVVASATSDPAVYRFNVVTGVDGQQRQIYDLLSQELAVAAAHAGTEVSEENLLVSRLDAGNEVRAASRGIATIFGVIGWGVLLLGALGLLVSQLIVVRDRMWFFGLSRALGAGRRHVVVLVLVEVCATVLAGMALALLVALALQPVANGLAKKTFDAQAPLLDPSVLPQLLLGTFLLMLVAGAWPAWRATVQDPLDVLEPRQG